MTILTYVFEHSGKLASKPNCPSSASPIESKRVELRTRKRPALTPAFVDVDASANRNLLANLKPPIDFKRYFFKLSGGNNGPAPAANSARTAWRTW